MSTPNEILYAHGIDPEGRELFDSPTGARYGSTRYFEEAMAAGFYGVDDRQQIAFRKLAEVTL